MEFSNKTAVVTGAASGMGFLCSKTFAEKGAKVSMLDVNAEALNDKVNELRALGLSVIGIPVDLRKYDEIVEAREKTLEAFKTIDIVVNCAGGSSKRIWKCNDEFINVPIEVFDWGIDVNLKGPFYVNHVMMKQMVAQKSGVIVNIGSITGEEGCPSAVDYSAAKSGVMYGLTKSLALYGAQYGIRVCCVSPGPVLTRAAMSNMSTLVGRAAEPEEIVDLIMFVASDKGAFIDGTNFLIDGGRNIMRVKRG